MDLSFHVPTSNTQFVGDEHRTSVQMLWQATSVQIDGGGSSETVVATFNEIAILAPRTPPLGADPPAPRCGPMPAKRIQRSMTLFHQVPTGWE